jgi:hypothetical protein
MVLPEIARRQRPGEPRTYEEWERQERKERIDACIASSLARSRGEGGVSERGAIWLPFGAPRFGVLEDLAIRLDAAALRITKGRGAFCLAIGECLDRFFAIGGPKELSFANRGDYARERLGLPKRTMYDLLDLARTAADLPELKRAVIRGEVSPKKARIVGPALLGHPEWAKMLLAAARTKTEKELSQVVRELGEEAPADPFEIVVLKLGMTEEMQDHLDEALALSRAMNGPHRQRWVHTESIGMEFLAAHPEYVPDPPPGEGAEERKERPRFSSPPSARDRDRLLSRRERRDDGSLEAALSELFSGDEAIFGVDVSRIDSAEQLDERLRTLLSLLEKRDEPLGRILETISTLRLYGHLGHATFTEYARERLGLSERTARQRVWLERRMVELPPLRAALATGRLTYTQAIEVAQHATPGDVTKRIKAAERTSVRKTRERNEEEEDRQNRALGVRRLWGPSWGMEVVEAAISTAQAWFLAERGIRIGRGQALGVVSAHFVDEWRDPVRRKRIEPLKRKVRERTKGMCSTPGCGNPADHAHHVIFRSDKGPDELWNLVGLCFSCHRRIHREGRMTVTGRAGEHLSWRIRRGGVWELWETIGDDDVRRVGEEPVTAPWP